VLVALAAAGFSAGSASADFSTAAANVELACGSMLSPPSSAVVDGSGHFGPDACGRAQPTSNPKPARAQSSRCITLERSSCGT
jgi:hypothetical protein